MDGKFGILQHFSENVRSEMKFNKKSFPKIYNLLHKRILLTEVQPQPANSAISVGSSRRNNSIVKCTFSNLFWILISINLAFLIVYYQPNYYNILSLYIKPIPQAH